MPSTLTRQQTDPHDAFAVEPGAGAARADQASPDPVHEVLSLLSRRRAQTASGVSAAAATPTVDTTFRAAAVDPVKLPDDRPAMRAWAKKAIVAFLFALCSALAAATWRHHGDTARQLISSWMPPFALTSSAPTQTPPLAGQPPVQAAAADQAPAQPAPAAQPAAGVAPMVTPSAADSAQLLPSMARDLATMGQQIEQLKASIEQLRDDQAQMSRDIAKNSETRISETKASQIKASEPNLRRAATLPPRPVAAPPRKPRPALPQAAATSTLPPQQYPAPPQPALSQPAPPPATVEPDGEPVVRPPMPLH
jgi:hypothetical protein